MLSFKNIMSEQPNGEDYPHMELKHSNTGYVWINPGTSLGRFVRRNAFVRRGRGSSLFRHGAGSPGVGGCDVFFAAGRGSKP